MCSAARKSLSRYAPERNVRVSFFVRDECIVPPLDVRGLFVYKPFVPTMNERETSATPPGRITSFKVDPIDHERLERVAAEDERSVSAVIRLAIRRYLDDRLGRAA